MRLLRFTARLAVGVAICAVLWLPPPAAANGTGIVIGSNVRIREAPTVASAIVTIADRGEVMEIVADSTVGEYLWVRVRDARVSGWIRGDYVMPYGARDERAASLHARAADRSATAGGGAETGAVSGRGMTGNGALLWIVGLLGPTIAVLIALWFARKPEIFRQRKTYAKIHGAILLELIENVGTCCYIIERTAVKKPVHVSFTTTARKQMLPVLAAYSAREHGLLDIYELVNHLEPVMRDQEEASRRLHNGDEDAATEAQERAALRAHGSLATMIALIHAISIDEYAALVERLARRAQPLSELDWRSICAIGRFCLIQEKVAGDPKLLLSYSILAGALTEVYGFRDPATIVGGLGDYIAERDGELVPTTRLREWVALTSWSLLPESATVAPPQRIASRT
jgi:hypothetical protein